MRTAAFTTLGIAFTLVALSPAVAAQAPGGNVDWFLSPHDHTTGDALLMFRGTPGADAGLDNNVVINGCQLWVSNEALSVSSVMFNAQTIRFVIRFTAITGVGDTTELSLSLGKFADTTNTFTPAFNAQVPVPDDHFVNVVLVNPTANYAGLQFLANERVAAQVCIRSENPLDPTSEQGLAGNAVLDASPFASFVDFDETLSAPFPTPELGTLLLSSTGVLALAGIARFRKQD